MKIYLVDVSSMFFRAFYAIRPLNNPSGVPVNAVYGFLSMLTRLLREEKPEYVVFCYDRKEPSFRKDLYAEYKANRTEMPEDLAVQIPYIKRLADALGIPSVEVDRYEADDLIGCLTKKARAQNMEVLIVSGDKDFGQLVGEGVILYDTMKEVKYDSAGVMEKWGIRPDQMIDYLSLVGDSSDNVPGVAGIGPKGAIKLLSEFQTLQGVYDNLDKISSKSIREKLETSRDNAFLSQKLVTIACDINLSSDMKDYRVRPMDRTNLRALLQELNFKTFEKSLLESAEGTTFSEASASKPNVAPVIAVSTGPAPNLLEGVTSTTTDFAEKSLRNISAGELSAAIKDGSEVWGFSVGEKAATAYFIANEQEILQVDGNPVEIGPILQNKKLRWSGFDLKTFWRVIGFQSPPLPEWDAMLAAYAVQAGDRNDPAKVAKDFLGLEIEKSPTPARWLAVQQKLQQVLKSKLAERKAEGVYQELEIPLVPVLFEMEKKGILLDKELLAIQGSELADEIIEAEKKVHELAGEEFNIGSPKQLGVVLFEKMGLPSGKKTKTGYSTDADVLEKIEHPIGAAVSLWRELTKLKSTYVDALPQSVGDDGRIHTVFNQAIAATGRLSSQSPNLQNISVRTERGRRVRQAFIAAPGMKLLSVDYSQVELRVLAHISEDPGLTRAFAEDLDIHAATAAEVFNVALKDVTSDQRRVAKAVNFGIAYGQEIFGLSEALGIPRNEAKDIISRYFEKFSGVREYIESTIKKAHEQGYVETLFGRRRYIEELRSKIPAMKKFGERAAINAPIQGTASDLVKKAMIDIHKEIPVPMLLQVHDELIFEADEATLIKWTPRIVEIMEKVTPLKVPLKANHAIGDNWDEAH